MSDKGETNPPPCVVLCDKYSISPDDNNKSYAHLCRESYPTDQASTLAESTINAVSQLQAAVTSSVQHVSTQIKQSVAMMRALNSLLEQYILNCITISIKRMELSSRDYLCADYEITAKNETTHRIENVNLQVSLTGPDNQCPSGLHLFQFSQHSTETPSTSISVPGELSGTESICAKVRVKVDDPAALSEDIPRTHLRCTIAFPSPGTGLQLSKEILFPLRPLDFAIFGTQPAVEADMRDYELCLSVNTTAKLLRELFSIDASAYSVDYFIFTIGVAPGQQFLLKVERIEADGKSLLVSIFCRCDNYKQLWIDHIVRTLKAT